MDAGPVRGAARLRPLATCTLRITALAAAVGFLLFLPFAGRFLVDEDPLERADLIFVLAGARTERWLEAVDLYKEGWAPLIVLSPGPVDRFEPELHARGIRYPREGELARDAVVASGVPGAAVIVLPSGVDNTAQEAAALLRLARQDEIARVIVVTSPYHTRRAKFAFRRTFADSGVRVHLRGTRHSDADPRRWWRRRADIRFVTSELPKLLFYLAGVGE